MEQSPFEKFIVFQLVKKLLAFHGTRRFITVLTRARHLSLSWSRWIHSTHSHPISVKSILILSSLLRFRSYESSLLPSRFPSKILYSFLISHIRAIQWNVVHKTVHAVW